MVRKLLCKSFAGKMLSLVETNTFTEDLEDVRFQRQRSPHHSKSTSRSGCPLPTSIDNLACFGR